MLMQLGLICYQLVRNISVVLPGHPFADGRLHQTGQGGQHIDRRVDLRDKGETVSLGGLSQCIDRNTLYCILYH